jgi:two-component system response regulator HydG
VERRKGKFEAADKGTLFLDEIGEIDANTQVHLLRALEERKITRVGGNEETEVDVRIIAATNRDLRTMIDEGRFREDLFYRLNVVAVDLPALRYRQEDILPLAEHFLKKYAKRNHKSVRHFSPEALECMLGYRWRGNVRELENMVERGVILSKDKAITPAELPPEITRPTPAEGRTLDALEKNHILSVLDETGGNIARSARILGIHRMTLYNKLRKHGMSANKLDT